MAKKKEQKKPLTVESLKNLGFRMLTHINGGSTFSSMTRDNKEYGLLYCYDRRFTRLQVRFPRHRYRRR